MSMAESVTTTRSDRGFVPDIPLADQKDVSIDCGWGRLIFANTFHDAAALVSMILAEQPGKRDVAFYVADPHVALNLAPFDVFLDPSNTYRLKLDRAMLAMPETPGYRIRLLDSERDVDELNRISQGRGMVQIDAEFALTRRDPSVIAYLVAEETETGAILGGATAIDHLFAFGDPDEGGSLWSLVVDAQALQPGIGEALVIATAARFKEMGRHYMDLSVLHSNAQAIALYEKLGFERLPVFALKTKSSVNEKLFIGPSPEAKLNPYARIITDEARRRGITIEVVDEESCLFRLSLGGRSVMCRESLTSLTAATAMAICDDKALTRRILARAGLRVPDQAVATEEAIGSFLEKYDSVVVKPARGEQGRGIAVGLSRQDEVEEAVERARQHCETVLLEECVFGHDVRIVVIDFKVVAAAIRRPAEIVGTGQHDVQHLIDKQSRRRAASTGGESKIPVDQETIRCLRDQGLTLESVPEAGQRIQVRRTANLHTGGTIHDITDEISPRLAEAAVQAAVAIDIPVVGLDLIVPDIHGHDYWFIEANERPGLANHDPQPTAERFVTMLFPQTAPTLAARKPHKDTAEEE